jgi:hypothetical protein
VEVIRGELRMMNAPVLYLPSARLDEFAGPAGEFVKGDPEDSKREVVGNRIVLDAGLDVLHFLALMTGRARYSLELVEEGDGFDETEEAFVVAPGADTRGREGEVLGVGDHDSDGLENALKVVVSPADDVFGNVALEAP